MRLRDWFRFDAPFGAKLARALVVLVFVAGVLGCCTTSPTLKAGPPSERVVAPARLREHVEKLAVEFAPRDFHSLDHLNAVADYIAAEFEASGGACSEQSFSVDGATYRNIIAEFGPDTSSRIVVGAHYDGCGDTPGADDNASGVAGLIELARLLKETRLERRVELVAYTLEEPPFFRTKNMGSAHHAARARKNGVEIKVMLCLEMIGYFSDEPDSQGYPSIFLKALYPNTGDFLAVIGACGDGGLTRKVKIAARGATDLPVRSMSASKRMPMVDFSDHLNYWNRDYPAVMLTDTAFMRNRRYHGPGDTPDTLDYARMAKVVLGAHAAVVALANEDD